MKSKNTDIFLRHCDRNNKPVKVVMTLFFILLTCSSLLSPLANAMSLHALVDRNNLSIDETLTLTLILDKQGANKFNFSELELQFDILHQSRSSQASIVNGKVSAETRWTLILAPKETGTLVIPSFSAMGMFSNPITIEVTDTPQANPNSSEPIERDIFLEASVNKKSVYVQEQILLTLKLYYRVPLSGYTPQKLEVDNAIIELSKESNSRETINGQTYNILEKSYTIHPQASGELVIPRQSWQVEKSASNFGFGRISSPYLRINSSPQTINVAAVPVEATGSHWLPAQNLSLTQQWQQSIITAKVGEPLTYTLNLSATGLLHTQLPEITIDSTETFTVYNDQAEINNQFDGTGVTGTRISHYAVIPTKAGTYTFPGITLRWWNLIKDQEETITLEPQKVIVANTELQQQIIPPQTTLPIANDHSTDKNQIVESSTTFFWQLLSALFALFALIFLGLWLQQHYRNKQSNQTETPAENNTAPEESLKDIYLHIQQAIDSNQWKIVKQQVLYWGSLSIYQQDNKIHTLEQIIEHYPALKETLHLLDKHLYSQEPLSIRQLSKLVPLLKSQKNTLETQSFEGLKALYPR